MVSGIATLRANPVEIGVQALERKHYATALRAWIPAAKMGNPRAQNNLGYAYLLNAEINKSIKILSKALELNSKNYIQYECFKNIF